MKEEVQYYFRTCLRIIADEGRENNPALISNTNKPARSPCLCPRKGIWHQGLAFLDRWLSLWVTAWMEPRRGEGEGEFIEGSPGDGRGPGPAADRRQSSRWGSVRWAALSFLLAAF